MFPNARSCVLLKSAAKLHFFPELGKYLSKN